MNDASEDARLLALWAAALTPRPVAADARARLMAALDGEPHLPFCSELAQAFALPIAEMRALLARIVDSKVWSRGIRPFDAFFDFHPGASLAPLRGGFVRLSGGARLPLHRHTERELTYVLAGEMVDGDLQRFGPGSAIDMPVGSVHSIGVPEGKSALVALLHGRIEMVGG
jgi:hypothetical protein